MTSNNESVSRQMPGGGNVAKTMTSNGKQFTVTREMLTAVARDRWNLIARDRGLKSHELILMDLRIIRGIGL